MQKKDIGNAIKLHPITYKLQPILLHMLYVHYGTDFKKVNAKTRTLIGGLRAKRPDAAFTVLESAEVSTGLEELVDAQGLFNQRHIAHLRAPFETAEGKEAVLTRLPRLAESANIFVVSSPALDAPTRTRLEKHAERMECYTAPAKEKPTFNVFVLGDLVGSRDKKALWVTYQEALRSGFAPEELHGTFFWAVKSMLLAVHSANATEAGQKPFVYAKFARYAKNFTTEELIALSRDLVVMYHEVRQGTADMSLALEQWVLRV